MEPVNSRFFIQVVVCVLFSYYAQASSSRGDVKLSVYGFQTKAPCLAPGVLEDEDDISLFMAIPRSQSVKYRTKFRASSFLSFSTGRPEETCETLPVAISVPLYSKHKKLLLPFYYAFLFRLTPF